MFSNNHQRRRQIPVNNVHLLIQPAGILKVRPVRKQKLFACKVNPGILSAGIPARTQTLSEVTGFSKRTIGRRLELQTAIMMNHFVELIMKAPSDSINFDLQQSVGTVEFWIDVLNLDGLFLADKTRALNILMWVKRFRLSINHKWIRRVVKYEHVYYSAVLLLAGPEMVNDPLTAAMAVATLNKLNLTPLLTLPV